MTVKNIFYSSLFFKKNNTLFLNHLRNHKKTDENTLSTTESICSACSEPDIDTLFKSVISLYTQKPCVNRDNTEPRHRL